MAALQVNLRQQQQQQHVECLGRDCVTLFTLLKSKTNLETH